MNKYKTILFLGDGMADEPIASLGGKTPIEAVDTPAMDSIADQGSNGTFLSLPDGFPTSSDVANMSVMGYDLALCYPGRGPLESVSQGIELTDSDFAWRCNLVTVDNGILTDYSAGHIDEKAAKSLMLKLQDRLGSDKVTFLPGVSYRNLLVLHGDEFSSDVLYHKPDSSQGETLDELALEPMRPNDEKPLHTIAFLNELCDKAAAVLAEPDNTTAGNAIWPWSSGKKPNLPLFSTLYPDRTGAVITAVDVIKGIAKCAGMDVIDVPGATGFIDTNYAGKASAAVEAAEKYDFVYLHIEAIDECSHMGELEMKMRAISDFDSKVVAPVLD
ncbi:MAG: 2,3-bisphosphoglycerate-independent phosphoglycerate mutase, partial [Victivallales bacterium]|nr:2,3-bisphosphoglycerate-independent phosphoglycerate mutase [Victivallales bacterium]